MRDYPRVTNHRLRTIFPEQLQLALLRLRTRFQRGHIDPAEINDIVSGLSHLPAETYRRAGDEIVHLADLHRRCEPKQSLRGEIISLVWPGKTDRSFLLETPGLEYLYLFHRDGYLREEALGKIDRPLNNAFFFNSIAYRLNDWAEPVREAARVCAARVFPQTPAHVVAQAAFVLLERMHHWQRWDEGLTELEQEFARPDVTERLAVLIETAVTGSSSRVLAHLLRNERMDGYLLHLARKAVQPAVRAIALRTLITGHASWPDGFGYKWTNKALGQRRRVVEYGIRRLDRPVPVEVLIAQGATDKAALVRRVAADGLVQHRKSLTKLDELIGIFIQDKTMAVKERALFILGEKEQGII